MRRDGWPRSPFFAEALVFLMWHGANLTYPVRDRIDRAVERWDKKLNAAAFNEGDE